MDKLRMMKKHYVFLLLACVCSYLQPHAQCTVHITQPIHSPAYVCSGSILTLAGTGSGSGGSLSLDQSQLSYNAGTSARTLSGYSEWQSFTAGTTGTLEEIDMGFFNAINGSGQLKVFTGSGTGGSLLYSATVNVVCVSGNCLIPFIVSAPVVAGQMYSFQFIPGAGIPDPYGVQAENPGTYAGGEMNIVDPSGTYPTGFDMIFKTWVRSSGGGVIAYHWSTGATDSTITIHDPGKYYVTVTSGVSCTAVDSISILKDSTQPAVAANATSCGLHNGSASVHVTGGISPYSFLWSNGADTASIFDLQSGNYYLTVTDSIGCQSFDSINVGSSTGPVLYLSSDPIPFCGSDSTEYCVLGGFTSYHWSNGVYDSCIWVYSSGSYILTVTDFNSCSVSAGPVVFIALTPPEASVFAHHDTLVASTGFAFQWYLNGQALPGDTFQVLVASNGGAYSVLVTDSMGCSALSDHHFITGIEVIQNRKLDIWPNPAFNEWHLVTGADWLNADIRVFDAAGKLVYISKITAPVQQINADLSSGVYLMQISSPAGSITRKLVRL